MPAFSFFEIDLCFQPVMLCIMFKSSYHVYLDQDHVGEDQIQLLRQIAIEQKWFETLKKTIETNSKIASESFESLLLTNIKAIKIVAIFRGG